MKKSSLKPFRDAPSLFDTVFYLGESSWEEMLANGVPEPDVQVDPRSIVNIQYTSGTTGSPKGVLLTHRNILNNGWFVAQCLRLTPDDTFVNPFPLYHCAGCVLGPLGMVSAGFTLVLPSAQFDPRAVLTAVAEERGTALLGVPTMFIAELELPDFASFDLSSLRTGAMGGAPCPIELMKRVTTEMHIPEMTVIYGQTEASPTITLTRPDDDMEHRVCTIGCALPNTEIKIVDSEGKTVPAGERGELCTRGYLVMAGYDHDPAATARAVDSEGWLHTGDLAVMRSDGYFRITGRAKDMIIRGGENIYPAEVEALLNRHPKVSEVQIVGVPDEKLGEIAIAWIRLRAGESASEQEILDFCRDKIAYFKIPQHIRFVDSFPLTISGKVQKFRIREIEIEERQLQRAAAIQTA
jgi:fatty-acyl-CoA synthase